MMGAHSIRGRAINIKNKPHFDVRHLAWHKHCFDEKRVTMIPVLKVRV